MRFRKLFLVAFSARSAMIFVGLVLSFSVFAVPGAVRAEEQVFATIHIVNAQQVPRTEQDWVARLAADASVGRSFVWVYDVGFDAFLMSPDPGDSSPLNPTDGLRATFDAKLRQAVANHHNTTPGTTLGASVDIGELRYPLSEILKAVQSFHKQRYGSGPKEAGIVDIVLWADQITVGSDIDLSEGYLPIGCVADSSAAPPFLPLGVTLPEGLYGRLVIRSLNPERAAATVEAREATLAPFLRNQARDGQVMPPAYLIVETSAGCSALTAAVSSTATLEIFDTVKGCQQLIITTPAKSACNDPPTAVQGAVPMSPQPRDPTVAQILKVPPTTTLPYGTPAPSYVPGSTPSIASPQVVAPSEPKVKENALPPVPAAPVSPPFDTPPLGIEPQIAVAAPIDPAAPNLGAARSLAMDRPAPFFAVIQASAPHITAMNGLALVLDGAPVGSVLSVSAKNQGAMSRAVVITVAKSGIPARFAQPDAAAQSGAFQIMLAVNGLALCGVGTARISATVSLPLALGAALTKSYQIEVSPSRCVDAGITTLSLDLLEVP